MFLGIDLGTSSLKALVLDVDGTIVGTGSASYVMSTPQPGWAESDPQGWWDAAATAVPPGALGAAAEGLAAITPHPRGGDRAERCLRHAALRPEHGLLGQGHHRRTRPPHRFPGAHPRVGGDLRRARGAGGRAPRP